MTSSGSNLGSSRAPTLADKLVLSAIGWYQQQISPRKGWRCAHSVLHGGAGCSGAVRGLIRSHGWRRARRLARERFRECHRAALILRAQNGANSPTALETGDGVAPNSKKRGQSADWCDCCHFDWCYCGDILGDCDPLDRLCAGLSHSNLPHCDVSHCDVSHCDVSHCDCSACDVSACDCNPCG